VARTRPRLQPKLSPGGAVPPARGLGTFVGNRPLMGARSHSPRPYGKGTPRLGRCFRSGLGVTSAKRASQDVAISAPRAYLECMPTFEFRLPANSTTVPASPDWLHEVKYDGFRLRLERDGDRVRLITKSGYNWTDRYPRMI
jgi:hypothetical protein